MQAAFDRKKIPCQTAKFLNNSPTFQSKQNSDFPESGKAADLQKEDQRGCFKPWNHHHRSISGVQLGTSLDLSRSLVILNYFRTFTRL